MSLIRTRHLRTLLVACFFLSCVVPLRAEVVPPPEAQGITHAEVQPAPKKELPSSEALSPPKFKGDGDGASEGATPDAPRVAKPTASRDGDGTSSSTETTSTFSALLYDGRVVAAVIAGVFGLVTGLLIARANNRIEHKALEGKHAVLLEGEKKASEENVAKLKAEHARELAHCSAAHQRELATLSGAVAESAKQIEEELRQRFGLSCDVATLSLTVENLEGDQLLEKKYERVRITRGVTMERLPHSQATTGTFAGEPKVRFLHSDGDKKWLKTVKGLYEPKSSSSGTTFCCVSPALSSDDPPISYAIESRCMRGSEMSLEEALAKYANDAIKDELHVGFARWPLRELRLEVALPKGYNVTFCPAVFVGGTEVVHGPEHERALRSGTWGTTDTSAKFFIKDPLVGFDYAIRWQPIEKASLDALKASS